MGISKEAFEKGEKPLEEGSLEYDIFEYLKNAKETDEPARNRKEILKAINKRGTRWDIEVRFALLILGLDGTVVAKHIKQKGKYEFETYYMANE